MAPIKIHEHPQKSEYLSPSEWITTSSQAHILMDGLESPAHVHLDWTHPPYGEIVEPFECPFSVTLFNFPGYIDGSAGGIGSYANQVDSFKWDATGTSTPPVMKGVLNEAKSWSGKVVFTPNRPHPADGKPATRHGWYVGRLVTRAQLDNGAKLDLENITNYFSMIDPSLPENFPPGEGRIIGSWVTPYILNRPDLDPYGTQFGVVRSEYNTFIPLASLDKPWVTNLFPYSYTAKPGLPNGKFQELFDLDLHNGVPGRVAKEDSFPGDPGKQFPVVLDPTELGTGLHKVAQVWEQNDGRTTTVWALTVIKVNVGIDVPPPVIITPTYEVFSPVFKRLVTSGQPTKYRIYDSPTNFKDL